MKEKRGTLGGEKDNMVKSQPKKEVNNWFYNPIWDEIGFTKPPKIVYYELRVWKNHDIVEMNVYTTLKEALLNYEYSNLSQLEDENKCYVEIIKIDNLNPRYK